MANICDNDFTYYGDNQRELLKFYLTFQQAYEEGNGDAKTILSLLGVTPEMIEEIDGRTSVNFVELLMSSETITGVRFMAESAWAPCEDFAKFALLAAIPGGGDIDLCYVAEEPGCEVFINTDIDRRFYDVDVHIDVCCKDYEDQFYYGTADFTSLVSMIEDLSGVSIIDIRDLNDKSVLEAIHAGFDHKYPESSWLSIHTYSNR